VEVVGQLHAPAALLQGKSTRYPVDKKLSGPQSPSGRCGDKKNFSLAGNQTPAVQPVVRRYTERGIQAP
jgi:hypothetical protein